MLPATVQITFPLPWPIAARHQVGDGPVVGRSQAESIVTTGFVTAAGSSVRPARMELATRIGLYVLITSGALIVILVTAATLIHLGRVRARTRQRRLLASPTSTSSTGEAEVVVPVLPHPAGPASTSTASP